MLYLGIALGWLAVVGVVVAMCRSARSEDDGFQHGSELFQRGLPTTLGLAAGLPEIVPNGDQRRGEHTTTRRARYATALTRQSTAVSMGRGDISPSDVLAPIA